jgi:NAD+ kinase
MKIAIYGRQFNNTVLPHVQQIFNILADNDIEVYVHDKYKQFITGKIHSAQKLHPYQNYQDLISSKVDVMISLGGDGTLLDTVTLIRDSNIPVIGINFGRLGFLASINKDEIASAIKSLINKEFTLDNRVQLCIESELNLFGNENFALNDVTIHKRDTSAMMIVHAYLNGDFLNSYWADGLIVATPTGSTAYSLSCGGPIVFPRSGNMVVTPISPHNLNVRPIVLSDTNVLSFEIEGRSPAYLASLDARSVTITPNVQMAIRKAPFFFNLIRLKGDNFIKTLKDKMMWGIDSRN